MSPLNRFPLIAKSLLLSLSFIQFLLYLIPPDPNLFDPANHADSTKTHFEASSAVLSFLYPLYAYSSFLLQNFSICA